MLTAGPRGQFPRWRRSRKRLSVCSVLRCPDLWLQCSVHGLEKMHQAWRVFSKPCTLHCNYCIFCVTYIHFTESYTSSTQSVLLRLYCARRAMNRLARHTTGKWNFQEVFHSPSPFQQVHLRTINCSVCEMLVIHLCVTLRSLSATHLSAFRLVFKSNQVKSQLQCSSGTVTKCISIPSVLRDCTCAKIFVLDLTVLSGGN